MAGDEVAKHLIQELRDKETEVRQLLRGTTTNANLSIIVIAGGAAYLGTRVNVAAFSIMPIFINIVALTHLSYSIDTRHLSAIRDWLSEWANDELRAPVFATGALSGMRRSSGGGAAPNIMATLVLWGSWFLGLRVAWDHWWFWPQVVGTTVFAGLTAWAVRDFLTIDRRTREALALLTPVTMLRRL